MATRLPTRIDTKHRPAFNSAALYGIEGTEAETTRNQIVPTFSTRTSPTAGLYSQIEPAKAQPVKVLPVVVTPRADTVEALPTATASAPAPQNSGDIVAKFFAMRHK